MIHYISPEDLTFEQIDEILSKNYTLELSKESITLINKCKEYLDKKIAESKKPLYGITTGFGSLCKISISTECSENGSFCLVGRGFRLTVAYRLNILGSV